MPNILRTSGVTGGGTGGGGGGSGFLPEPPLGVTYLANDSSIVANIEVPSKAVIADFANVKIGCKTGTKPTKLSDCEVVSEAPTTINSITRKPLPVLYTGITEGPGRLKKNNLSTYYYPNGFDLGMDYISGLAYAETPSNSTQGISVRFSVGTYYTRNYVACLSAQTSPTQNFHLSSMYSVRVLDGTSIGVYYKNSLKTTLSTAVNIADVIELRYLGDRVEVYRNQSRAFTYPERCNVPLYGALVLGHYHTSIGPYEVSLITNTIQCVLTGLTAGTSYKVKLFLMGDNEEVQTSSPAGISTEATVATTSGTVTRVTYTGDHIITGDNLKGQLTMLSSGSLTWFKGIYDAFCVGGGGGGGNSTGGCGGYTNTLMGYAAARGGLNVVIGAGGNCSVGGGSSVVAPTVGGSTHIGSILSAQGGGFYHASTSTRGTGGSGGGAVGDDGDEDSDDHDAGNGGSNGTDGGKDRDGEGFTFGSGVTTRAFGESANTLYAGGGGGYSVMFTSGGFGGAGGGGRGSNTTSYTHSQNTPAVAGTPNTGGGGGGGNSGHSSAAYYKPANGGSGVAIIRWGY